MMQVRAGKILSANEVLNLPEWHRTLLPDLKKLDLKPSAGSGLYGALREEANKQTSRDKNCQVERELSKLSNDRSNASKWNGVLKALVASDQQGLAGAYAWADTSGRRCYPQMVLQKDGERAVVCLKWAAIEADPAPAPSPAGNWHASLVLRVQNPQFAGPILARLGHAPLPGWNPVTALGRQTLAWTRELPELANGRCADELVAAARWALHWTRQAGAAGAAALVVDRPDSATDGCGLTLSADLEAAWQLVSKDSGDAPEGDAPLLVNRATYCELRHEFHCEPLEDFDRHGPAYRVWSEVRPTGWLAEEVRRADGGLDSLVRAGGCYLVPTAGAEAAWFWFSALRRWAHRKGPPGFPLFLDCMQPRQQDLLNPIVEGLRDWMNLNRVTHGSSRNHDLDRTINSWVDGFVRIDSGRKEDYRALLRALLLSDGLDSRKCEELMECLAAMLENAAKDSAGLTLVIHNLHAADRATRELVTRLDGKKQVTLLATCEADQLPPWTAGWGRPASGAAVQRAAVGDSELGAAWPQLSDDDRLLLTVALAIGPDALRTWLRNVWCRYVRGLAESGTVSVAESDLGERFERACARLLGNGFLRISGRLADLANQPNTYRELSFASAWHWQEARRLAGPTDAQRSRLKAIFATVLGEYLDAAHDSLDSVRRKILVCNCLRGQPASDLPPRLLPRLIRLWLIVAGRAQDAGFLSEAVDRIQEARRLLREGLALRDGGCDLNLQTELAMFCLAMPTDAFAFDTALTSEASKLIQALQPAWRSSNDALTAFGLSRSYWSFLNRWADSQLHAEEAATELERSFLNSDIAARDELRLEVQHLLAVTRLGWGQFEELIEVARKGREICLHRTLDRPHYDATPRFGSHCGGGCCKALLAFGVSITRDDYEAGRAQMKEAIEWTNQVNDPASQTITRAYQGMLSLFFGEYGQAMQDVFESFRIKRTRGGERWRLMAQLVWNCASIGQAWRDRRGEEPVRTAVAGHSGAYVSAQPAGRDNHSQPILDDLYPAIGEQVKVWEAGGRDYLPIWRTFQGVAACTLELPEGPGLIESAIGMAQERQELLYLPAMLRWQALMRAELGDRAGAELGLQEAIAAARELGAALYVRQAATELESLAAP